MDALDLVAVEPPKPPETGSRSSRVQPEVSIDSDGFDYYADLDGGLVALEDDPASAPELRKAAEHLKRLEADQMLMLKIAARGWEGKDFEELAGALFAYGYQVFIGWILTGKVFGELRQKNIAKLYSPANGIPRDQAMELAFDTVQESVVKFRDRVLKRNRWNPAKGATLKTFFIGFCLFIFPNFYRSWLVSWHNPANSDTRDPVLDPLPLPTDPQSRTEEVALARAALADVQDKVDEVTLAVLRLRVERYTFKEIGEILGISESRAKTLAHRYRPQHG